MEGPSGKEILILNRPNFTKREVAVCVFNKEFREMLGATLIIISQILFTELVGGTLDCQCLHPSLIS